MLKALTSFVSFNESICIKLEASKTIKRKAKQQHHDRKRCQTYITISVRAQTLLLTLLPKKVKSTCHISIVRIHTYTFYTVKHITSAVDGAFLWGINLQMIRKSLNYERHFCYWKPNRVYCIWWLWVFVYCYVISACSAKENENE